MELGRRVFAAECGACHVVGGPNDVTPLIASWNRELLVYNLERIHKLKLYMPPLVGTPAERRALADYLFSLNGGREVAAAPER